MLSCPRYFKTNFLIKILPPLFQEIWPIMHSGPGRYLFSRYRQNSFNFINFKFFLIQYFGFQWCSIHICKYFSIDVTIYDVWITNVRVWLILTKPGRFLFLGPGVWTNSLRQTGFWNPQIIWKHVDTKNFNSKLMVSHWWSIPICGTPPRRTGMHNNFRRLS